MQTQTAETSLIDGLIESARAEVQRREDEETRLKAEEKKRVIANAKEKIAAVVPDLWRTFEPYVVEVEPAGHGKTAFKINAAPLGLSKFYLVGAPDGRVHAGLYPDGSGGVYDAPSEPVGLGLFFGKLRESFREVCRVERARRLHPISFELRDARIDEARALKLAAEWVKLAPEQEAEARKALADWRELKALNAEKQKAAEEYRAAFAEYLASYDAVRERNKARIEAAREALNQPFKVWHLEYALVSGDSEGEISVDVATCLVLHGDTAWSLYPVLACGGVTRKRFFNRVSISGPLETTPQECSDAPYFYVDGVKLSYPPSMTVDEAKAMACIEDYPEKPQPPSILDSGTVWQIENQDNIPY